MSTHKTSLKSANVSSEIKVSNLTKRFMEDEGKELLVLDNVSFEVEKGEFASLLGPSGCGKSTILNIIAKLVRPDSSSILIDGVSPWDNEDNTSGGIGYVFQTPRLLRFMNIENNIRFALEASGIEQGKWNDIINENLELVGLQEVRNKYPHQLSGGMQQRVGIARALSVNARLILMDEPFSHLDQITARRLRSNLMDIWTKRRMTVLFVTHDMFESVLLSDKVYMITQKPAHIFGMREIKVPRPRADDDPKLFETYAELLKEFHAGAER